MIEEGIGEIDVLWKEYVVVERYTYFHTRPQFASSYGVQYIHIRYYVYRVRISENSFSRWNPLLSGAR